MLLAGEAYLDTARRLNLNAASPVVALGVDYDALLAASRPDEPDPAEFPVDPEDPLVILYTSGTTGLPKGAVISHRAMIARAQVIAADLGLAPNDAFVAWPPFFHMASTDQGLATLLRGGPVIVVDGYDPQTLLELVEHRPLGWLVLIPGMIEDFLRRLRERPVRPMGIKCIGAMPDLVASQQIAAVTELLQAPYVNTFGATETGLAPATASFIGVGEVPADLAKRQSSFCEVKLVDADGREVALGEPGECAVRGPTLFSGYWRADDVNVKDFRGGWFHMGDVFARRPDGRLQFMDRVKYLIKSGGENIYPAEVERVLLADPRVDDAVVVRRADARWSEVPVAAVASNDPALRADELLARCRRELAGYKQPKEIRFVRLRRSAAQHHRQDSTPRGRGLVPIASLAKGLSRNNLLESRQPGGARTSEAGKLFGISPKPRSAGNRPPTTAARAPVGRSPQRSRYTPPAVSAAHQARPRHPVFAHLVR